MTFLIIFMVLWVTGALFSFRIAHKAGETDWKSLACINLVPIAGSVLAIITYLKIIADNENKKN